MSDTDFTAGLRDCHGDENPHIDQEQKHSAGLRQLGLAGVIFVGPFWKWVPSGLGSNQRPIG